jgi:copper chaperone
MPTTIKFKVEGMTCDHCVHAVTSAIEGVEGVSKAEVSLADRTAVVEGEGVDTEAVVAAVKEEGYEASVAA